MSFYLHFDTYNYVICLNVAEKIGLVYPKSRDDIDTMTLIFILLTYSMPFKGYGSRKVNNYDRFTFDDNFDIRFSLLIITNDVTSIDIIYVCLVV
jgi:hypothetical protein